MPSPLTRVAMIGQKGFPPVHGGIEKHVAELAARLPAHGFAVDIYSRPHYSALDGDSGLPAVTVRRLPSIPTKHLDAITHTARPPSTPCGAARRCSITMPWGPACCRACRAGLAAVAPW